MPKGVGNGICTFSLLQVITANVYRAGDELDDLFDRRPMSL